MSFARTDETGPTLGAVPAGLISEPPLSPMIVGRPKVIELPVQPVRTADAEHVHAPEAEAEAARPEPEAAWAVEDADAGPRRVLIRLAGGDAVELGETGGRDEALLLAREVVRRIAAAEADGEWPELDGRLLRPGAIVSVDVLRTDR